MHSTCLESMIRGILTAGPKGGSGQDNPMMTFFMMLLLIGFSFYFIILRPQKKEQSERKRLLGNLKKGDKIVTIGGLHGTVIELDKLGDTVVVEVAKGVKIKFLRTAISTVQVNSKSN